jgi:hypothetical protein
MPEPGDDRQCDEGIDQAGNLGDAGNDHRTILVETPMQVMVYRNGGVLNSSSYPKRGKL